MTETVKRYMANKPVTSIQEFLKLPCALPSCHPDYMPPDPEHVSQLISFLGWSQREVALITGVKETYKGSTTVRRWKTAKKEKEHRQIPNGIWQLLLIYADLLDPKEIRKALVKYHKNVVSQ